MVYFLFDSRVTIYEKVNILEVPFLKLKDLMKLLEAEAFTDNISLDKDIDYVFSCDLMSDVLMITREASVEKSNIILTTGLATNQSVRTAEMLDVEIICLVRGKKPSQKMIEVAEENDIMVIGTAFSTFKSNGLLFEKGLEGVEGYVTQL